MQHTPHPKREVSATEQFYARLLEAQMKLERLRRIELIERMGIIPLRACPNSHWFYKN